MLTFFYISFPLSFFSCCSAGYGTYKVGVVPSSASSAVAAGSTDTEAVNPADCVAKALELGYRFFDCAEVRAFREPPIFVCVCVCVCVPFLSVCACVKRAAWQLNS